MNQLHQIEENPSIYDQHNGETILQETHIPMKKGIDTKGNPHLNYFHHLNYNLACLVLLFLIYFHSV